jgi:hypothetical protein
MLTVERTVSVEKEALGIPVGIPTGAGYACSRRKRFFWTTRLHPRAACKSCSGVELLQHGATTFFYEEFMETLTKSEKHAFKHISECMAL